MGKVSQLICSFFFKALPNIGLIIFGLLFRFWGFPGYSWLAILSGNASKSFFAFFLRGWVEAFQAEHIRHFFWGLETQLLWLVVTVGVIPTLTRAVFGVMLIHDTFACASAMTFPCLLVGLTLLWTYVAAAACPIRSFLTEEPFYESGGYSLTVEKTRVTITENDGYEFGKVFSNYCIYAVSVILLSTVGIVFFVIDCVKAIRDLDIRPFYRW